jgi:hypothetical protein
MYFQDVRLATMVLAPKPTETTAVSSWTQTTQSTRPRSDGSRCQHLQQHAGINSHILYSCLLGEIKLCSKSIHQLATTCWFPKLQSETPTFWRTNSTEIGIVKGSKNFTHLKCSVTNTVSLDYVRMTIVVHSTNVRNILKYTPKWFLFDIPIRPNLFTYYPYRSWVVEVAAYVIPSSNPVLGESV